MGQRLTADKVEFPDILRSAALPGREHGTEDIGRIIEDLRRSIVQLQEHLRRPQPGQAYPAMSPARAVRTIARLRSSRTRFFTGNLFADPAWDIMLHLYASHLDQRRETVSGVISLAELPPTTGLRWVRKLAEEGMVRLRDDPLDQRRRFIELTSAAVASFEAFFRNAATIGD